MINAEAFRNPGREYNGITLWMLNDKLEPDEIARQLGELYRAGIHAVITRTFNGLRTEYLSDEWMEILDLIVCEAGRLDMKVFFQAGYMPSAVPDLPSALMHRGLVAVARRENPPDEATILSEDEKFHYVVITLDHVLDILNRDAAKSYVKKAYEEPWSGRFGRYFGNVIQSIWVDEPHFAPPALPWGDSLETAFRSQWGYSIVDAVPALFRRTDDSEKTRHHYWRTVLDLILNGYFYEVSAWCERNNLLFSGHLMGEDSLTSQVAFTAACMPLYRKMHIPGIDHLTGNLRWSHWRRDEGKHYFIMTPKQSSSAANQTGKEKVLAEMYGVSTQGIRFADRKRIFDWFAVLGVNYVCLHGSFYSLKGRRKRIYVPHLSFQQPWWGHNAYLSDYYGRVGYALRQGRFRADVLVLHPVESAFCVFEPPEGPGGNPTRVSSDLDRLQEEFCRLSENLMAVHRGFEYGDEHSLQLDGSVENGRLRVGRMAYRAIVLPDLLTIRESTCDLLTAFLDAGGTVIATGALPERIDGVADSRIGLFNCRLVRCPNTADTLGAVLNARCPPEIEVRRVSGNASDVWIHERRDDDGSVLLFLLNISREGDVRVEVVFPEKGAVEELDAETGEVRPVPARIEVGKTAVILDFPPGTSRLLRFSVGGVPAPIVEWRIRETKEIALSGEWQVSREGPNALTLDFCKLKREGEPFSDIIPISAVREILREGGGYSGGIVLRFEFEIDDLPRRISVVIEDANKTSIRVNGVSVGYDGLPYYSDPAFLPVDITDRVTVGTNVVDLAYDFKPLETAQFGLARLFANLSGTEVESIYLIGDFAVVGEPSKRMQRPESLRFAPDFRIARERPLSDGRLIESGYPFFTGAIRLRQAVRLPGLRENERAVLRIPGLEACVGTLLFNGRNAGYIYRRPFEADVSDYLRDGENEIVLEVTNTLRNLLGPHHRPLVEGDNTWGEQPWSGAADRVTGQENPGWWGLEVRETDMWTDDYFFLRFGVYDTPVVEYTSRRNEATR